MLSGARRGEQKGSLTTGELCTLISANFSERSGSNPSGNPPACSRCDPSSPVGGGMAIEDRSLDTTGSASVERKNVTSSGYIKGEMRNYSGGIRMRWVAKGEENVNKIKRPKIVNKLGYMCTRNTLSLWKSSKILGSLLERLEWTNLISRSQSIFKILRHFSLLFFSSQPLIQSACVKIHARIIWNALPGVAQPKCFDILSAFCSQIISWKIF